MKHWIEVTFRGHTSYALTDPGSESQMCIEVGKDGTVRADITPQFTSTTSLTLGELKELVTLLEAHEA